MGTDYTAATRIISAPDGTSHLELCRARLSVLEGPDAGLELRLDVPRIRIGTGRDCDLCLKDPAVSRDHLELIATPKGFELRDLGSTNGTFVSGVRLHLVTLLRTTKIRLGETAIEVAFTDETVRIELSSRGTFGRLLGESTAMRRVFAVLEKIARTETTVVLEGESGTGKELAAEALHDESPRRDRPFIVVDCGAIPANLMESELFGHERGAFTGAERARIGAIEAANGGTIFFDEIGELPLELQPRLLRFLESMEVKPVGSAQHRKVDVRVIAATNRKLADEVKQGRFREDLFYRLSVVRIELPPLRERPEDVLLLAMSFAERFARDPRSVITDEMVTLLRNHEWPGNVRELRNVVERLAVVPAHGLADLRERAGGAAPVVGAAVGRAPAPMAAPAVEGSTSTLGEYIELPFHEARTRWQERFERQYLLEQLDRAGGVVARAARQSELPRQSFHRLLKRHGLRGDDT